MLDEGIYRSTLILAHVYFKGAYIYRNRSKNKAQNS